jgi:ribosomal protein L6P/L9E
MLKLGQSAMTAYPIPANVNIYCPTDQQQQAENQPLLLTSTNYKLLTDVVSEIKSYKVPDVYKGSGVFLCERIETEKGEQYINETILRKVIKKK